MTRPQHSGRAAGPGRPGRSAGRGSVRPQTRHRQLAFSLATEALGQVRIESRIVGDRVRLSVRCDRRDGADALLAHATALREQLAAEGWSVDELTYGVAEGGGAVAQTLLQHVITQDSVSLLV